MVKRTTKTIINKNIEMVLLEMLNNGPTHGYKIIGVIRKKMGVLLGPSTVYPALVSMEKENLVTSTWRMSKNGRPFKEYALTPKGIEILKEYKFDFNTFIVPILESEVLVNAA